MRSFRLPAAAALLLAVCALATGQGRRATPDAPASLAQLLPYVGDPAFQKDLKLKEGQVKRLLALRQKVWDETYTTAPKDLDKDVQDRAAAAAFQALLDAGQVKRAGQLAARTVWGSTRTFFGGPADVTPRTASTSALARREIAEALELDETQKKLVETTAKGGGWRGFRNDIYLTPEQTAAAKALLGEAPTSWFGVQSDERRWGTRGPNPTATALIGFLLVPDVHQELKMSAVQIKAAYRQQAKRTAASRRDDSVSPAEQTKIAAARRAEDQTALEKILDAGQLKRLEQIGRQRYVATEAEFAAASELGKVLRVTDEQRKAHAAACVAHTAALVKVVASGEAWEKVTAAADQAEKTRAASVAKILTPEQAAKKQEWLGQPFKGDLDGRRTVPRTALQKEIFGRYYTELSLLAAYPRVREELQVTADQLGKLRESSTAANEKFPVVSGFRSYEGKAQNTQDRDKLLAGRSAFVEKALADILTKEQRTRLRELLVQHAEGPRDDSGKGSRGMGGGGFVGPTFTKRFSAVSVPGVAEEVKLTAEQKKELFEEGIPVAAVLTEGQKAAIKKRMGKPVDVAVVFARLDVPNRPGRPTGSTPGSLAAVQKLVFGKPFRELVTLSQYPRVREELKLGADQVARVQKANTDINEKFSIWSLFTDDLDPQARDKHVAGRSALVEKALADILTKEQQTRFRELQIQWREALHQEGKGFVRSVGAGVNGYASTGAVSVPGVAEEVKLTPEQRKKILDGTKPAEVLTDAQKATIKKLMGKEVDVAVMFNNRSNRPGFTRSQPTTRVLLPRVVTLARSVDYWDEVKITPEQAGKLARAFNEYTLALGEGRIREVERRAAIKAVTDAVESTLTVAQARRLEQLMLQSQAASSLVNVLLGTARNPSATRKELGITDEQEKAILAAEEELSRLAGLLDSSRRVDDEAVWKSVAAQRMSLREKLDARIEGLLTTEQKAKWKALLGEPHPGLRKRPLIDGLRRRMTDYLGRFDGFEP